MNPIEKAIALISSSRTRLQRALERSKREEVFTFATMQTEDGRTVGKIVVAPRGNDEDAKALAAFVADHDGTIEKLRGMIHAKPPKLFVPPVNAPHAAAIANWKGPTKFVFTPASCSACGVQFVNDGATIGDQMPKDCLRCRAIGTVSRPPLKCSKCGHLVTPPDLCDPPPAIHERCGGALA